MLAKTAFHLGSASLVLSVVEDGLVRSAFPIADHIPRLKELAVRYADRAPDLADLCLIRLSELHPKYPVITTDSADFRVYRRGRRELVPRVAFPPAANTPGTELNSGSGMRLDQQPLVQPFATYLTANT